jgi:hypothetical protein
VTIIGVHISAERALLWCDSEIYQNGKPIGHFPKMAVSNLAHAVVVGAGTTWTNILSAEVLTEAASLDQIVSGLANIHQKTTCRDATILVAGWSHQFSHLVSFVFRGSRLYEPFMTNAFELPGIGDHVTPEGADDIVPIAQRQMIEIRRDIPDAGAGQLTVAQITRDAITIRPLYDLGRGEFLRAPLAFKAA